MAARLLLPGTVRVPGDTVYGNIELHNSIIIQCILYSYNYHIIIRV